MAGGVGAPAQGLRLLLLCVLPATGAALLGDHGVLLITSLVSVAAAAGDALRQRRRSLPFPIYLLLIYALQASLYILLPPSLEAAIGEAMPGTLSGPLGYQGNSPRSSKEDSIKTLSIVMAAHNEHKYMARTLDSIYKETPASILKEIIVVDDGSTPPLLTVLQAYPDVKVLRHETRKGLIKSKTEGGNMATSDAIMFLDAHIKPSPNWVQPLMRHMNRNYKRVVVPVIPILDGNTWEANMNAIGTKMMFDWTLFFSWFEDHNDLVPCMSGGLFGITRQWWHESGEYDYGMNMWGAENIEQSIRVWLCGGEIYVVRESKVAHVFRPTFPYEINNTEIYINKVRTVEVWFDEFKQHFYEADPAGRQFVSVMGDISERLKIKETLHCKPFKAYMEMFKKVFKSKHMLPENTFLIRDKTTGLCLDVAELPNRLAETQCDTARHAQRWTLGNDGHGLRLAGPDKCLDADAFVRDKEGQRVLLYACQDRSEQQAWSLNNGRILWRHLCIKGAAQGELTMEKCDKFLQASGSFEKYDPKVAVAHGKRSR